MSSSSGAHAIHSGTWTSWMWSVLELGASPCRTPPAGTSRAGSRRRARCRSRRSPCRCGTSTSVPSSPPNRPYGSFGSYAERIAGNSPQNPARPGRPSDAMAREPEDPPEVRRLGEEAAEPAHLAGAVALLDRAGEEEEHAGDQTVGDHAEDRGVDAEVGEGGDAEHHEAHVRDRRERDQALHVSLRETAQRAVDDADHREQADPRRPRLRRARAASAARCG